MGLAIFLRFEKNSRRFGTGTSYPFGVSSVGLPDSRSWFAIGPHQTIGMRSHRLKLNRALDHLSMLHSAFAAWSEGEPCAVVGETDIQSQQQVWSLRVLDPPPLDHIALLVGDTLHNLRQCLDHLAYALAGKFRGTDPGANSAFPLIDNPANLRSALGGNVAPVKRMPQALIDAFDKVQPYNGGHYELLAALKALHDRDKHREPTVVAGGAAHLTSQLGAIHIERGGMKMFGAGSFAGHGTPVFEITGRLGPEPGFSADFDIAPSVAFSSQTPFVPSQPVAQTLNTMRNVILLEIVRPMEWFL